MIPEPTPLVVVVNTFALDWNKILALVIPNVTLIVLALIQLSKTTDLHLLLNSSLDEWKATFLKASKAEGVLVGRAEVVDEHKARADTEGQNRG